MQELWQMKWDGGYVDTPGERRCRQEKTHLHVRWKMIQQSGHMYNFVQVAYTTILGDKIVTHATSTELRP